MRRMLICITAMSLICRAVASAQVKDSAGVKIVTSSGSVLTRKLPWRIDTRSRLDIGGDDKSALGSVTGGLLLQDGRFAVMDGRNRELKLFNANGTLIRKAGGRGNGPGEFQTPALSPAVYKDSLPVSDMLGRVSLFTSEGTFARSVESRAQIGSPRGVVGGMLVTTMGNGYGTGSVEGWQQSSILVNLIDLTNGKKRELAVLPGPMTLFAVLGGMASMSDPGRRPKVRIIAVPMAAQPSVVAASSNLWATDGVSYTIHRRNQSGIIDRIYRVDAAPPPMRADLLRNEKKRIVDAEEIPELKKSLQSFLDKAPSSGREAAFDALVVDTNAGVWARLYQPKGGREATWVVFDAQGVAQGTISIPAELELLSVQGNRMLARVTDEDDVQTVALIPLLRS